MILRPFRDNDPALMERCGEFSFLTHFIAEIDYLIGGPEYLRRGFGSITTHLNLLFHGIHSAFPFKPFQMRQFLLR